MTEKPLEYCLVDLMTEVADDPEKMQAIINVITFLKRPKAKRPGDHTEAAAPTGNPRSICSTDTDLVAAPPQKAKRPGDRTEAAAPTGNPRSI